MRLRDRVYLLGSGLLGMNTTDDLDCNVYLLDGGSQQAIIDCGTGYGVAHMLQELRQDGFKTETVQYIFLTHAHMDHAGGAAAMRELTGAQVVASPLTAPLIERGDEEAIGLTQARAAGVYPPDCHLKPCRADVIIGNGQTLQVGDLTLEAIETPGHSRDMISLYCRELRTLFCGDTVFAGGRIAALRTPDFSMAELSHSLSLLDQLQVDSLMPGHLSPVVRNGGLSIRQAVETFERGAFPESIV